MRRLKRLLLVIDGLLERNRPTVLLKNARFQEQPIKGFSGQSLRANKNKRLTVLSEAEKHALYD